jgi:microcystin-dependent protein
MSHGFRAVNAGEALFLDRIVGLDYTLRLFTNDVTAGLTDEEIDELVVGDFTQATFPGYAAQTLSAGASWTITAANPSEAVQAVKTFTRSSTGTAQLVYGHYYTVPAFFGALVAFEQYDAPISVEFINDAVRVIPTLTLDDAEANVVPTGSILPYAVDSAADPPVGWLFCDGSAVSRSTYADLFATIGTAYGVGDGSTTFNLPDVRQRFILGQAASGTGVNVGDTGGAIDHVHDLDTASSHAQLAIGVGSPGTSRVNRRTGVTSYATSQAITNVNAGNDTTATTTGTALAGDSDTENPPFVTASHIIKT